MLCGRGLPVERLRALAAVEAERKQYLLKPSPRPDRDPAPFGDIGRHMDLRSHFLDPQRSWSPTMLEDAAACPFSFFARHVLRLTPRTEPDYDVSPGALGEVAHSVLSEFFRTDPPRQVADAVQRMRAIADQVLTRRRGDPGLGHPSFWHVRKAELLAALEELATYVVAHPLDNVHTQYHEQELSGSVACGACSITLKGRVDRVVMHQGPSGIDAVFVQDFKYSGSVERYREALGTSALGQSSFQLPVYLYLTLQRLAQEGHHLAPEADLRLQYWLLKESKDKVLDAQVSHTFFAPDQIGGLLQGLQRVIEPALHGRFAPQPLDATRTCTYCSYAVLCRYWSSGAGIESRPDTAMADEEA
jgi:ATP-dependent helicase/DNAse subunit B